MVKKFPIHPDRLNKVHKTNRQVPIKFPTHLRLAITLASKFCFDPFDAFNCVCFVDVNECNSTNNNNCSDKALCINTVGGYNCSCNEGYQGTGFNCTGMFFAFRYIQVHRVYKWYIGGRSALFISIISLRYGTKFISVCSE